MQFISQVSEVEDLLFSVEIPCFTEIPEDPFLVPDYNSVILSFLSPKPPSNHWNYLPNKPHSINYFPLTSALDFYVCFGYLNLSHDNSGKEHRIFILVQGAEKFVTVNLILRGLYEHLILF